MGTNYRHSCSTQSDILEIHATQTINLEHSQLDESCTQSLEDYILWKQQEFQTPQAGDIAAQIKYIS